MFTEPSNKRVAVFFDGQNLFHAVRNAFGTPYPNFNVVALSKLVAARSGWELGGIHTYTGLPSAAESPRWRGFWVLKLSEMRRHGVRTVSRDLVYRTETTFGPGGKRMRVRVGQEKGIDVRIALDVVRLAREDAYDVAVLFSQDQDLREVASEIRAIARMQGRWIKIASAFPVGSGTRFSRGIDRTDWLPITREEYERCLEG
ncbi:MAG: NYN domain-containing protein [Candidatus Eisenbacteria bacterium]|uniref:NYN domain-containing protein n=1 Tax=Eiseniibacteriota bacterium TaxID=2212470 RepID=A0A933SFU0_UNCEI|nr:NYN domain-containing protein [Candidatus Eisenbacteria bacterium]